MGKVFTIAPGLENMGAMKTGGQGSVYKARRTEQIITAVKLLPTPVYSESEDDKNFRDFKNEVQKLKRVNEKPNPNIVKILSSGLSETGNFPFIEMEYIEGPDLEELLKPPHDPVFTIKEVIKVAEQLSNALAHCHSLNVKHGDIKSNNVRFNIHTGNYVLLDFGLAVMSDEQRRTSLRHAGAVEFMAPEQNEGQMLFQTDVYSFGVVLFELLAGQVPFPLHNKGETARNNVRIAHLETLPPDVVSIRKEALLPYSWTPEKRAMEMDIPEWLVTVIYKCLRKKPENRFANGIELHEYIITHGAQSPGHQQPGSAHPGSEDIQKLKREKEQLQQQVLQYKQQINDKERQINDLKAVMNNDDGVSGHLQEKNKSASNARGKNGVSKAAFAALVLLSIGLATFSAYNLLNSKKSETQSSSAAQRNPSDTIVTTNLPVKKVSEKKESTPKKSIQAPPDSGSNAGNEASQKIATVAAKTKIKAPSGDSQQVKQEQVKMPAKAPRQYMVTSKAYFYNTPDETSRRNAFVVPSNTAILNALDEQNNFILVEFRNQLGQSSKGWLQKKDLQLLNE